MREFLRDLLAHQLDEIALLDPSNDHAGPTHADKPRELRYDQRNAAVFMAVAVALQIGYKAGVHHDPAAPDLMIAYIELPSGQVSWHLPAHPIPFDLHSTADKYARIRVFVARHRVDAL